MNWPAALVLVAHLGGCSNESGGFPVNPGGGGGTGTETKPDAAIGDDASAMISGRVCLLLSNPQSLASCAASGAGGLTVTLGSATAITNDDGSFTLMRPASTSGLVWRVTGTDIKTSVIELGATTTLPAIDLIAYGDMVGALQAIETTGQGALMTRVTREGVAVSGATVASQPRPDSLTYYDGPTAFEWQTQSTGPFGVAWIPSLPVGSVQLTITSNQLQTAVTGDPVFADSITFVFAEIP